MAKHIIWEIGEHEYRLEFNRESLAELENMGFVGTKEHLNKFVTAATQLMNAALSMHHPRANTHVAKKILDDMQEEGYGIVDIVNALMELWQDAAVPNVEAGKDRKLLETRN
jgi:DNA-binding transcriptional regulator YhcF (GntR family)